MIGSLYKTMNQKRKKKTSQGSPAKKPMTEQNVEDKENGHPVEVVKFPLKPKKIVRKKVQYIKRMEV